MVAQRVEDWAQKQQAPSSRLSMDTKRCSGRGRSQNTTKLCQGKHPPHDSKRDGAAKITKSMFIESLQLGMMNPATETF